MAVASRSTAGGTESGDVGNGNAAATTARIITRRRSLPSGRAVLGGFLVLLAAVGAFAAARGTSDGAGRRFVVAGHDIAVGTMLTEGDLRSITIDLTDELGTHAFTDVTALIGTVTVAPLAEGDLVQRSQVVAGSDADPGYQVSLPVDRARALGGDLRAGERVDVLVTYGSGSGAGTFVVARAATVVAVDHGDDSGFAPSDQVVVTLSVAPDEALAVTHAGQAGKVTVLRSTGATSGAQPDAPDEYHPPSGAEGN